MPRLDRGDRLPGHPGHPGELLLGEAPGLPGQPEAGPAHRDTGPTHRFWEVLNRVKRLKVVITEASFPNELQELADVSGHLTPQTLDRELKKLKHDVPVYL